MEWLPDDVAPAEVQSIWAKMIDFDDKSRIQSMSDVIRELESLRSKDEPEPPKVDVDVLVVEDDEDDLFLTVEMLKRINQSVRIHTAHSLKSAISICTEPPPIELVLLELRLPDSTGIDTVHRMRETAGCIPIVVLTGQDDLNVGKECIEAGADDFACKNDLNAHMMERMIFITLRRVQYKNAHLIEE